MKTIFLIIMLFFTGFGYSQNVGIGTSSPDASSILEVQSSTKGVLFPSMNETDRNNITSPAKGLTVYQTDNKSGVYYYDGNSWQYIGNIENNAWKRNIANQYSYISFSGDKVGIGKSNPSNTVDVNGYIAADNFFTIIPLYKGTGFTINNNAPAIDVPNCESGINPVIFEKNGNLQVKMIIRATNKLGTNNFQLRAHNGTTEVFPIVSTDTWTWACTGGGDTVTSPWKDWNAGTSPFEIHLNAFSENSGDFVDVNAVYLVIRSKQP